MMVKVFKSKMNKSDGFTLVETIVTLVLLCVISLAVIGILTSAMSARSEIETKLKDQIAIRQAVLVVTSDIRKDPYEDGSLGPMDQRYEVVDNKLIRIADGWGDLKGSAVAADIAGFDIRVEAGRAVIQIQSLGGQIAETRIFLRVF